MGLPGDLDAPDGRRADAVLSGEELQAGDKVLLFYNSANRDEEVFDDPYVSTCGAHRTRTWGSGPPDPTSASVPTSPGGRSP